MGKKDVIQKEIVYYFAIFILFFVTLSGNSRIINIPMSVVHIIEILAMLLLIIKISQMKIRRNEIFFLIVFGAISLYEYIALGSFIFLCNFMVIVALRGLNFKNVVKIDIFVKAFYLILHCIMYFYYYDFNYEKLLSSMYYSSSVGYRNSLLFSHPNAAGSIAIFLAIDLFYISENKLKTTILSSAIVIFVLALSKSRTSLLIYVLFLIIYCAYNKGIFKKLLNILHKYTLLIISIINLLFCVGTNLMKNDTIYELDRLLSGRLKYSIMGIKRYGMNFWPNLINDAYIDRTIKIDNFYVRCFIEYGGVILILLNLLYFLCVFKRKNTNLDKAILVIFPIFLVSELVPFNVARAICMLVMGNIIMNGEKIQKIDNGEQK